MPEQLDGNETQNRKIAKQLFSVWEEEQASRTRRLNGSLPAWIACVLSIGLLIWNAAVISAAVADHSRRITQLEADWRQQERDSSQVIERMARIEAKLDLVIEDKKR